MLVGGTGCKPHNEFQDEMVRIDDGFRPTSTNAQVKHRSTVQKVTNNTI